MGFNCKQWLAGLRFPSTDRFVVAGAGERLAVWAERNTVHKIRMACAHGDLLKACRYIIDPQFSQRSRRPSGLSKPRSFLVPNQRMDRPNRLKECSIYFTVNDIPEENCLVGAHRQRFAVRAKCQRRNRG